MSDKIASQNKTEDRIAVIGGGIAGMAAAHFLTESGAKVTLFEASDKLGGLGTFFPYRDKFLEKFYHCVLPGDNELLEIVKFLKLESDVYWRTAEFGFISKGRLFGLNTPLELLKFKLLPFSDRIRIGLTALWGSITRGKKLDQITTVQWLTNLSGKRAFEVFWKPMLQAKFGNRYHEVPALWFWMRFNREKGTKKEVKGYIRGGYKHLTDRLSASLIERGAEIHLNAPISSLDLGEDGKPVISISGEAISFDRVIFCAPLFFLHKMAAKGRILEWTRRVDSSIDAQGVVNVVLLLKRAITPYYWVAAIDEDVPFQGIVESSVLLERADTAGYHLIYLMNYCHRTEPLFQREDGEIADEYVAGLRRLFPQIEESDIVERFVFKAPFVETLYTLGYLQRKPPEELVPGRVFLATTSQVYPEITSWEGSTRLAKKVSQLILERSSGKT